MTDWGACERRLAAGIETLGIDVGAPAQAQLIAYLRELSTWNATYNLTAVRDPLAMVTRHLLDSLSVLDFVTGASVADIGSGPGLPGLVIAITRPRMAVTVVEANRKKAAFLRHARRRLELDNVTVVQERVESFESTDKFDSVICRAFAAADECARLAGHLIAPGGRFLLMKGRDPAEELVDLPLDFRHVDTVALSVPGLEADRHLAILEPGLI
ncbi:Ribosomal RNA small subunit methyltransferase G protein [Salinisphaera shabanensis E1L3A]|uniref:Ribosomal RNA small subunit methyltransferase G n=2 Tax=Salinisphaera shabanensis TaxID=180542 RepID=U2EKG3_9GAMM|nr:Ribosomal RNA small subunit methyltransferase G protein [Salinisphaera shabanensis E1L3A]